MCINSQLDFSELIYILRSETNSKYSFSITKLLTASVTTSSKMFKYGLNLKLVKPVKYKLWLLNK